MGGGTLLRRRLGAHPVAVAAIVVSVLAALVVVTALQLLSAAITDAGVRSALDVPAGSRSLVATGTLRPGDLAAGDAGVRAALAGLPATRVTRVGTATTRGLPGRAATDRAFLADVDGLDAAAELVDGRWPTRPDDAAATGDGTVEVVLPQAAAEALTLGTGDTVRASDLVVDDAPVLTLEVVGTFRPRSAEDPLWVDLPLGLTGVTATEFTTYGPFVLAPGTLDGPLVGASTVTWRATPDLTALAADDLGPAGAAVDAASTGLRRLLGLPLTDGVPETAVPATVDVSSPRVATALPGLLRSAGLVGDRIRVSLLTPVVLLGLLGAVALVGSSALLASLRDGETRLLRTRGVSTVRLALLALGDATLVTVIGVVGTAVLAPVAGRLVAGSPGALWSPEDLRDADLWRAVLPLAVLAVAVTVMTTLWVGRPGRGPSTVRTRTGGGRLAAGSGLDLVLVGLGVLGAVQLRRYDWTGSTVVDPVTTVAPALVVGGLAVLCLRLLPVLARWVSGLGTRRPGLDLAWGGWQFARRAASQSGTLLLVLLAVAMGTIALGHSATVGQAVRDQSSFETGAPLRVARGISGGAAGTTGALVDEAAGGPAAVMPVWRGAVDLGGVSGVTVLGVDAAVADRVVAPRPDTLGGRSWAELTADLVDARDLGGGVELPAAADELSLRVRSVARGSLGQFGLATTVQVRDGRGLLRALSAGEVRDDTETLTVRLAGRGLVPPVSLIGVSGSLPDFLTLGAQDDGPALEVSEVTVDGTPVVVPEGAIADTSSASGVWWAAPPADRSAAPAVLTREVARALDLRPGGTVSLPLGPRDLPITVAGIVDSLPTASTPTLGILLDLPTAEAVPDTSGSAGPVRSRAVFDPEEWWSAPRDPEGTATRIRSEAAYGTEVLVREEVVAERLADPVNAGMRSAMLLVTLASVLLAGVGFAASTAALGRQRRHENAVLLALGMPPGRIRRVLVVERALVVAVTVAVGLVLGLVSAVTVVPLLVGGDGHPQVPPVQVDLPAATLAGYTLLLLLALSMVGAAVLRSTGRDLAGELREGEDA